MYKLTRTIAIQLIVMCYCFNIEASTKTVNNNLWIHYIGKLQFKPQWLFTFETSDRHTDWGKQHQQWFIRPSIDYTFNKFISSSIGYSHYKTFSYGNPAMFKTPLEEDHIWAQISTQCFYKKWSVTNRIRNENRFIGTDKTYRNRLRYMVLFSYPISPKKLFIQFGDEAFFNLGSYSGKSVMNQNRIIAGLAWFYKPNFQIQLNYIHQNIWNYSNTIFENNPTIRLSILNNFKLYKNEK